MLPEHTISILVGGRKRVDLSRAEKLARGEAYSRDSLIHRPGYTPDVVEHLLRYHYPWLESMAALDDDVQVVLLDLLMGIDALSGQEAQAERCGEHAPMLRLLHQFRERFIFAGTHDQPGDDAC